MGSFGEQALPGTFFILFALWYVVQTFCRYFSCKQRSACFASTVAFSSDCLCGRLKILPMETFVKISLVTIVFSGEVITGFSNRTLSSLGHSQCATMSFYFGITAVVDLLVFYNFPVPPDIDYVSNILALFAEWLLFHFRFYEQTELNILLHTLLKCIIMANIAAIAMEMYYRHSLFGPLGRSYFLLLQGTWLWQVGFILYNPTSGPKPWKEDDQTELSTASLFFIWHCGVDFIIILLTGATVACCYHHKGVNLQDDGYGVMRLLHSDDNCVNGQSTVTMNNYDIEDDLEFQSTSD
ncbi:transmembrane protein 45B-like [Pomacea canaliculata]|uniref:transmembrane protein 45B-like n=1 Tax=Pomacea canaliculata TaxID=400727 RepID=UPI000D72DEBC|nr:transmembrane protein 45B-like [Pomacea canaliculata]XP_025097552.1 transmembrane protein 45B-like [Pomacea canaliculata]XP_025097553.1 transmembrane protein 45B-like [Pomacea canaliculata]XP_025097554.1 transmembrane protein 45B-like [Pomacea canaliculata]